MKKFNLIILLFFVAIGHLLSQAYDSKKPTNIGASILAGTMSFNAETGDLGDQINFSVEANYLYFIANNFTVGGEFQMNRTRINGFLENVWSIGPKTTYFFDVGTSSYPYISLGISYLGWNNGSFDRRVDGWRTTPALGVAFTKSNLVFLMEVSCDFDQVRLEGDVVHGYAIYFGVGMGVSLFPTSSKPQQQ